MKVWNTRSVAECSFVVDTKGITILKCATSYFATSLFYSYACASVMLRIRRTGCCADKPHLAKGAEKSFLSVLRMSSVCCYIEGSLCFKHQHFIVFFHISTIDSTVSLFLKGLCHEITTYARSMIRLPVPVNVSRKPAGKIRSYFLCFLFSILDHMNTSLFTVWFAFHIYVWAFAL